MLRYYKRHIGWVIAALLFGVATQLLTPFSAIMEQRMIDLIISGNMEGFRRDLWMAGAVVFAVALSYFFSGVARKCFEARLAESLRGDLYDGIMGRSTVRFEEKDTAEYMSYVTSNAAALGLYRGLGYWEAGRRKDFYTGPREDALLMTKYL